MKRPIKITVDGGYEYKVYQDGSVRSSETVDRREEYPRHEWSARRVDAMARAIRQRGAAERAVLVKAYDEANEAMERADLEYQNARAALDAYDKKFTSAVSVFKQSEKTYRGFIASTGTIMVGCREFTMNDALAIITASRKQRGLK